MALPGELRRILVRSTNWIGDAVMTTPAIRTIRRSFPKAEITLLALPWVADLFCASPRVDRILLYQRPGRHAGLTGKLRLAGDLRQGRFDGAILLQNAFEAALITALAGIPVRGGYATDGRGLLLTHGVQRSATIHHQHQVHYYQEMLRGLGCDPGPDELELTVAPAAESWAKKLIREKGVDGAQLIGFNPGAAYGPAKRWPAGKFAALARELLRDPGRVLLIFGTEADREAAVQISASAGDSRRVLDLTGETTLAQAVALINRCRVFVTNDSGLMHVAAALGTPLVAIFGSTDPVATGPFSPRATVVRSELPCSPCLETHCPKGHLQCMAAISAEEVLAAAEAQLAREVVP